MKCNTIRPGDECLFMTASGCSYEGGACRPVVEDCKGCERTLKFRGEDYCNSYPDPAAKWDSGMCNYATHRRVSLATGEVLSTNPLKASKRAAGGRRR